MVTVKSLADLARKGLADEADTVQLARLRALADLVLLFEEQTDRQVAEALALFDANAIHDHVHEIEIEAGQ